MDPSPITSDVVKADMRHSDRPSLLTKFFHLDTTLAAKPWGRSAVIVLAFQRRIVQGLTAGAVKG